MFLQNLKKKKSKSTFIQSKIRERAKEFNLMITIHKLLLAEAKELPGGKVVSTFQGPSCTETPAWSAWSLFHNHHQN